MTSFVKYGKYSFVSVSELSDRSLKVNVNKIDQHKFLCRKKKLKTSRSYAHVNLIMCCQDFKFKNSN